VRNGGTTLRSISHISFIKRLSDNDADYVDAQDTLGELREDNEALVASLREIRDLCDEGNDAGTLICLDRWIYGRATHLVPVQDRWEAISPPEPGRLIVLT
jgi:DNA-binding ferritin-like protein